MAKTLTPGVALQMVGLKYPKLLTEGFGARFANEVQEWIWKRYPWRGSLVDLPPFHLVKDQPDYGSPLTIVPADFLGLHKAWVREVRGYQVYPLTVKSDADVSVSPGIPDVIAYMSEKNAFRLHPRPQASAPYWWVEGVYKKTPTKITNANVNSYILPWDDIYFMVFRKCLEAKIKDELLGAQDAMNAIQYANYLIDAMAMDENLVSGVTIVAPAESLEL
jgi:hypothetical protein